MSVIFKDIMKPSTLRKFLAVNSRCFYQLPLMRQQAGKSADIKNSDKIPSLKIEPIVGEPKIIISESCIKRLKDICKEDKDTFLRVMVEGGGCSGFQYKFNLDKKINQDDLVFGEDEAKVVIDKLSIEFCNGATVDYHIELIRSGFRITANPLAEQGCSCGSSFAVRMD